MSANPVISAAAATGLLDAVAAAGGNPDHLLRMLGLTRSVLESPDGFIASASFTRMLEEAARETGDECFGLHFGEDFDPRNVGTFAYVILNSPTLAVAMQNVERYIHIHNQAVQVSLALGGPRASFRYVLSALPTSPSRQHNEYSMAVVLKTLRALAGTGWTPVEIQFPHEAPPRTPEHLRVLGCPVSFGHDANALVLDRDFLERLVPTADPRLYRILKRQADHILSEVPPENDLPGAVRRAIAEGMREGAPSLKRVAGKLSLSPRTVERRLKALGVDFRSLLDDTRRRFALDYLRRRRHTLTEIAFLLGYSEASAFNRAFKRWTGSTPLEYRKKTPR